MTIAIGSRVATLRAIPFFTSHRHGRGYADAEHDNGFRYLLRTGAIGTVEFTTGAGYVDNVASVQFDRGPAITVSFALLREVTACD